MAPHRLLGRIVRGILVALAALAALAAALAYWLKLHRPATRRALRQAGWQGVLDMHFPGIFIYGRWTNWLTRLHMKHVFPAVARKGPEARRRFADGSHAKIVPREQARAIVSIEEDIPLVDLERIIPYARARDLVLTAPPDIALMHCTCRSVRENPCLPDDVCIWIGQPMVDFVLEQNPTSRAITQEEALEIIDAEAARGHFQAAWFGPFNRFYAICNCCGCCCTAVELTLRLDIPQLAPSGYVATLEAASCDGCGECAEACPFEAIAVNEKSLPDREACMGCGVCVNVCPRGALSLILDESKGTPLDVAALGGEIPK